MQLFRNLTFSSLALVGLIALTGQAFAASSTVTVGLCAGPGTHYTTIQAAVNAVAAAFPAVGTVKVCPGTYPEQVVINHKNLTLIGVGPAASVVVPPATGLGLTGSDSRGRSIAVQISVLNANVTVSHITVDGAGNQVDGCALDPMGIYYRDATGLITDNAVRNQIPDTNVGCGNGLGIDVESTSGWPISPLLLTISNNSVRNYGKNGITVNGNIPENGTGASVLITGNTVVGLGATTLVAQNGIQVSRGATGTIQSNYVVDDIYTNPPDCASSNSCWGSSGILVFDSAGVKIISNTVNSTQYGIAVNTFDPGYVGDNAIIKTNHIGGTQTYDAIDVCSNNNTVTGNVIYGSSQDGIHADDSCGGTGINNVITGNTINEACAGILLGTGSNTVTPNTFMNVSHTTLAGDVCPLPVAPVGAMGMAMGVAVETSGSLAKHLSVQPN
jgi:parallel beta-helix repeat protein